VGLQRIIKHFMRQETVKFLVDQHSEQLKTGLKPEKVQFVTSIGPLRNASAGGIERCYDWLVTPLGKEIVRHAWAKCTVKDYALSEDGLAGPRSLVALISYLKTHPKLYDEINNKIGDVWGIEDMPDTDDEDNFEYDFTPEDDHTDVPMRLVVRETLGLDLPLAPNADPSLCVDEHSACKDANGDLVAASDHERIFDASDIFLEGDINVEEDKGDSVHSADSDLHNSSDVSNDDTDISEDL
jgi:hypothetical protein